MKTINVQFTHEGIKFHVTGPTRIDRDSEVAFDFTAKVPGLSENITGFLLWQPGWLGFPRALMNPPLFYRDQPASFKTIPKQRFNGLLQHQDDIIRAYDEFVLQIVTALSVHDMMSTQDYAFYKQILVREIGAVTMRDVARMLHLHYDELLYLHSYKVQGMGITYLMQRWNEWLDRQEQEERTSELAWRKKHLARLKKADHPSVAGKDGWEHVSFHSYGFENPPVIFFYQGIDGPPFIEEWRGTHLKERYCYGYDC